MSRSAGGPRIDIGLDEALALVRASLAPLPARSIPVHAAEGLVAAEDVTALVDSPPRAVSLKDGYAVVSTDLEGASAGSPVLLERVGTATAGNPFRGQVASGCAVRILTGALLPAGADAVLSEEFTLPTADGTVLCVADAASGRNLLGAGADVARGSVAAAAGLRLSPAMLGYLASAGCGSVLVHPRPRVGLLATGDELVAPGLPLSPGQIYASNMVTLSGWLSRFRMESVLGSASDSEDAIEKTAAMLLPDCDVLLTSGGAWKSERDRTPAVLARLGFAPRFHRVRLGPGKAVAFGMIGDKPVFCLPGGPPSNEMAFLQIVLPALLWMAGRTEPPFPEAPVTVARELGGSADWSRFFQARLELNGRRLLAHPLRTGSRLLCQANAEALIRIPEGVDGIRPGQTAAAQLLTPESQALAAACVPAPDGAAAPAGEPHPAGGNPRVP